MPLDDNTEYKFPDELESKGKPVQNAEPEIEIEIEDDAPPEDRGRQPLPKPLVEELERDELDQYDDNVKTKLKQMRKVWHDERREKESALREQQEAVGLAQRLFEENKRIKGILSTGEREYVSTIQSNADMELKIAQRAYKEAYDAGDSDKMMEANQALQMANLKMLQVKNFRMPSLQEEEFQVQTQPVQYQPLDLCQISGLLTMRIQRRMQGTFRLHRSRQPCSVVGLALRLREQNVQANQITRCS